MIAYLRPRFPLLHKLTLFLLLFCALQPQPLWAAPETPEALLHNALGKVEASSSYQIHSNVSQTLTPERSLFISTQPESIRFELVGTTIDGSTARFSLRPGRSTVHMNQSEAQEMLLRDGVAYLRKADRWERTDGLPGMMGIDSDGLLLAAAAEEISLLNPPAAPEGLDALLMDVKRVGFVLNRDKVSDMLLKRQGISGQALALARLQIPQISGRGELWIAENGYPTHLILELAWVKQNTQSTDEPMHVAVHSETTYSDFNTTVDKKEFAPYRSISTGELLPEAPLYQSIPWLLFLLCILFIWLLWRAKQGRRLARQSMTALLLLSLVFPNLTTIADASGLIAQMHGEELEQASDNDTNAVNEMLTEVQTLAENHAFDDESPLHGLDSQADEDGDGLPNGYELTLGTNPFNEDTDFDGLTDAEEIRGIPCFIEFLNAERPIISDPLNPDSNHDGLNDGDEYWRGECYNGSSAGYVWSDDNDGDGVPDGIDLSPFSSSQVQGSNGSHVLGGKWDGANFDFESLDMNPDPARTVMYPFYVEVQVRPRQEDALRWAYKHLYWPGDDKGAIQNTDPIQRALIKYQTGIDYGTSGKLTILPFLSAQVVESDLPSAKAKSAFGVSATAAKDEDGKALYQDGEALYELAMPLVPVEQGGQVYALQAKMLHDQNSSDNLLRRWQDVRLKWAVVGDVLMNDEDGNPVPSPDGGYGLVVYDEPFYITGLQVQRQGGASVLVAANLPKGDARRTPYDDGPITALRAGLEHKFLGGELSMQSIKQRFDDPSSATADERWGIPDTERFRVKYGPGMHYGHVDEALSTTTMTTTKQLIFNEFGGYESLQPTLVFATEQRTSTVNLDDDWSSDYRTISLNTCLKPLVTSRSLKLEKYSFGYDGLAPVWRAQSMDEVLDGVEEDYASATDPNYEFYDEELSILKLATTSWYLGQTAVQKIGQQNWQQLTGILSDAKLAVQFLTDDGLFPSEFKTVVFELLKVWDQGGPVEWLKKQWNTIVGYYEDVVEFFEGSYVDYAPPASRITILSPGDGPPDDDGNDPPSDTSTEAIDKEILGYTETALSVLGLLASQIGGILQEIVDVLTKLVQIYKKLRQLIDVIKVIVEAGEQGQSVTQLASTVSKDLGAVAKSMSIVGLVLAIGFIWITTAVQLNDVGPSIALTLIVKAIVETVLLVVLFVVAAIFPYGTIVALAIGLIKLVESLIGFTFDPISLLLDWLFSVETYERAKIVGDPQIGGVKLKAQEPGGGALSGRAFRISVPAITTMRTKNDGTKGDLEQAWASMHVGRFAGGGLYGLCTPDPDTLQSYKDGLKGYWFNEFKAQATTCINLRLNSEPYWVFTPGGAIAATDPEQKPSGNWYRDIQSVGWVDIEPVADINAQVLVDVSMDVEIPYDQCSTVGGCDRYIFRGTGAPSVLDLYMDILPSGLKGLWEWDELRNNDRDGDGLSGYINTFGGFPAGPDANICANRSGFDTIKDWDVDNDGLSDKFELETDGFDPCSDDSDNDKVKDRQELLIGTDPSDADTDNDGLTDYEEITRINSVGAVVAPWKLTLSTQYPGLPDPLVFPSPIQSNRDGDHRKDSKEKEKGTSPNSFNAIPVNDPLALFISQSFQQGGGTRVAVSTAGWTNDEAAGIEATLTVTLPVSFGDLSKSATVSPPLPWPQFNIGTEKPSGQPNVYRWQLPPLSLNRSAQIALEGLPTLPAQPVDVTASLTYKEGAKTQHSSAAASLAVNAGGPAVTIAGVTGGVILEDLQAASGNAVTFYAGANTPVIVQGTANDPQRVREVYVCLVASGNCGGGDWQLANGGNTWSYSFTPPADGVYVAQAYGVDYYGLVGETTTANVGVDRTEPNQVTLDLNGTVYLSTNQNGVEAAAAEGGATLPTVTISGQASDATGPAFVSGVEKIGVAIEGRRDIYTVDVDNPGANSSSFQFNWKPPQYGFGRVQPKESKIEPGDVEGAYKLLIGAQDGAGNASSTTANLTVVIDDTPPQVRMNPPQVSGTTLQLSGLVDDTGYLYNRQPDGAFAAELTANESDTNIDITNSERLVMVPDINGDTIADLVLLRSPTANGQVLSGGIFFGRPGGFGSTLSLNDADVQLTGEGPASGFDFVAQAAGAGDVNGDGVGDLLIGDPSGNSGDGTAYLLLGRRDSWPATLALANAAWRLQQPNSNGFGGSLSTAGDVNGDGLTDLLVGAASSTRQTAPVWLYLGRENAGSENSSVVATAQLNPPLGAAAQPANLTELNDTNGDGLSDFLIAPAGAPNALMLGRPDAEWPVGPINLGQSADLLIDGQGSQQTVAAAGDVNGDGLADALIGDPNAPTSAVYIMLGRRAEDAHPAAPTVMAIDDATDASFVQPVGIPSTGLGRAVASLGDLDGDGLDDFAFGEPSFSGIGRTAIMLSGEITLAHNQSLDDAAYLVTGPSGFGSRIYAGDIIGNGLADLLIHDLEMDKSHLFHSQFEPGGVAGVETVEVGLFGPVTDYGQSPSETTPASWQNVTLDTEWSGIHTWNGQLNAAADGDYRLYARAADRAGNISPSWYVGDVHVKTAPAAFNGTTLSMAAPTLTDKTQLTLAGTMNNGQPQMLRIWNGYEWQRLPSAAGNWQSSSEIPLHDLYGETFSAVGRDAFGQTVHAAQNQTVDTLIEPPRLIADLPANVWHTDSSPTLNLAWSTPIDDSGIAGQWAVIDTISQTVPTTLSSPLANALAATLDQPGTYYAHVRIQDGAGNESVVHSGPYLVNRSTTPSVALADGIVDVDGGEYPDGTLLNYDPYASTKPAAFWGTWNAENLYLGYPGNPWGDHNRLAIYLDTKGGGSNSTLPLFEKTHTLPFGADYALIVGGTPDEPTTLYQVEGGWQPVSNPQSQVVQTIDTEIVLNRAELGATGSVRILAYGETENGVWMTLPGGARPSTTSPMTGTLTFGDGLSWPALADGVAPGANQNQVTAPIVTVLPPVQNALVGGQSTIFRMTIQNPDVGDYVDEPVSLTVGPQLSLVGVDGAECASCPAGATDWELLADVQAGATQTVTVRAEMQSSATDGVFSVPVQTRLKSSGLSTEPQPASQTEYVLDQGQAAFAFEISTNNTQYQQPGEHTFALFPNLSQMFIHRCSSKLEVNTGGGYRQICQIGDCFSFTAAVNAKESVNLSVRSRGQNGSVSSAQQVTIIGDDVVPSIEISPTLSLASDRGALTGTTWDSFPTTQAPSRVEVSVNGGAFRPVQVSRESASVAKGQSMAAVANWRMPLELTRMDGQQIEVVARAVDEAGNVSEETEPMAVTLDNVAPRLTVSVTEESLAGQVVDGSGVATVEVSLDGGVSYQPISLADNALQFALSDWQKSTRLDFAMLRATDQFGNRASVTLAIPASTQPPTEHKIYLPQIFQASRGVQSAHVGIVQSGKGEQALYLPVVLDR